MGIGAVFGAILTMYTAVATRTREIATLRALGFNTVSVLVSVLAESLALGAHRRRASAARAAYLGVQRLSDVDDELPDVQPGGVRVSRHAGAAWARAGLRAGDGADRRAAARDSRRAAANCIGAERALRIADSSPDCRLWRRPAAEMGGRKAWQVTHVRPIWERHIGRRFVEPFCGGSAWFWG